MLLKNITNEKVQFEGTIFEPLAELDVPDNKAQKLLAMWWHSKLELAEDYKENKKEIEKRQNLLVCTECGKEFKDLRALGAHKRGAHK